MVALCILLAIWVGVCIYRNGKAYLRTSAARISNHQKMVAITFDDGPYGSTTDAVLVTLEQEKVPATFFLIGKNAERYPDQILREVADGDVIGNHSYSHSRDLATIASTSLFVDVSHAQDIIATTSRVAPALFRAPYGSISHDMVGEIRREGYTVVGWNVDPDDWNNSNSSTTIVATVMREVKPNDIILLHDGHEDGFTYSRDNTIEALPVLIDDLKHQGYTFVTADKILHVSPYR